MGNVWHLCSKAIFTKVGSNVFILSFTTKEDKARVENGQPWLFDNHFFALEPFDGLTLPKNMRFDRASLLVYLYQLPLFGMLKSVGEKVRKSLEIMEEVEVNEGEVG